MKTFEQKLQDEIYSKREEQWKECQKYLKFPLGKPACNLYNKELCPMRCDYAMNKIKEPLWVNENIQR